jgi:hypothetical protein
MREQSYSSTILNLRLVQFQAPAALSLGKEPLALTVYEVGRAPELAWTLQRALQMRKSHASAWNRTPIRLPVIPKPVATTLSYHSPLLIMMMMMMMIIIIIIIITEVRRGH